MPAAEGRLRTRHSNSASELDAPARTPTRTLTPDSLYVPFHDRFRLAHAGKTTGRRWASRSAPSTTATSTSRCACRRASLALETTLRSLLQSHVARGRVELSVSVQLREPPVPEIELHEEFVRRLGEAIERARAQGLVSGTLTPGDLMRIPQAAGHQGASGRVRRGDGGARRPGRVRGGGSRGGARRDAGPRGRAPADRPGRPPGGAGAAHRADRGWRPRRDGPISRPGWPNA